MCLASISSWASFGVLSVIMMKCDWIIWLLLYTSVHTRWARELDERDSYSFSFVSFHVRLSVSVLSRRAAT